jgi:hypothetical protein
MQPDPVELKCCDRFCCGKSSTRGRLKKPVGKRELARSSDKKRREYGGKRTTGVNNSEREEKNGSAGGAWWIRKGG